MKKIALGVLGCRVNQAEGEGLLALFNETEYRKVPFKEAADIYIIHTCTVTGKADSKSRQMIRKAKKQNPDARIVVTGCYAQKEGENLLQMEEVDLVLGMKDRDQLVQYIESMKDDERAAHISNVFKERAFKELPIVSEERTRAFVKIEEGCESFCTYCIIPMARGPIRSFPPAPLLKGIEELRDKGYKEVVLTGIHTGAYGKDLVPEMTLADLLRQIIAVKGIERIRLGSLDPNEIDEDFLRVFKDPKMMPHIHLSLQSGAKEILEKMKRHYTKEDYREVVRKIRAIKPMISITTDVMVGFPYEGEAEHKESMEFIKELGIDKLHIFKYSKREGTKAADFSKQVPESVKDQRQKEMHVLGNTLHEAFLKTFLGRESKVLIEKKLDEELWEGHNESYLKVIVQGDCIKENDIVNVKILGEKDGVLFGDKI